MKKILLILSLTIIAMFIVSGCTTGKAGIPYNDEADTNEDGIVSNEELAEHDPDGDPDGDGVTNREEFMYQTDPTDADTDGDGVDDGTEFGEGTDPLAKPGEELEEIIEYPTEDEQIPSTTDETEDVLDDIIDLLKSFCEENGIPVDECNLMIIEGLIDAGNDLELRQDIEDMFNKDKFGNPIMAD